MATETHDGQDCPVIYCDQVGDQLVFDCPHCTDRRRRRHRKHYHGLGEGRRVAHCAEGPLCDTGYILKLRK